MANSAYVAAQDQFRQGVHLLASQETSVVLGKFRTIPVNAERVFIDRLGDAPSSTLVTQRFQPNNKGNIDHTKVMLTSREHELTVDIERSELLSSAVDFTSPYVKRVASAFGRDYDVEALTALVGTTYSGRDGLSTEALDSTHKVAYNADSVNLMSMKKLEIAIRQLKDKHVNGTNLICFISPLGMMHLMQGTDTRTLSRDYNTNSYSNTGSYPTILGVQMIESTYIPDITAGTEFRAILCTKDALTVGERQSMFTRIDEDMFHGHNTQIATYWDFGFVRPETSLVQEIAFRAS